MLAFIGTATAGTNGRSEASTRQSRRHCRRLFSILCSIDLQTYWFPTLPASIFGTVDSGEALPRI
jgi:hypothetical protein